MAADRVRVRSLTRPGTYYLVERDGDAYACSCPAYSFGKRVKPCKHIALARTADRFLEKCAAAHGRTDGALCRTCLVDLLGAAMRRALVKERRAHGGPHLTAKDRRGRDTVA